MSRKRALGFLFVFGILLAGLGFLFLWWSSHRTHDSIILNEFFHTVKGGTVQNGSAFDEAAVDLDNHNKLIVPDTAEVRQGRQATKLQILMKKTLAFHGHRPGSMSIHQGRKNMGCALRVEGDSLIVATFGEWDSHIEGSASMRLLFIVPERVKIEQRAQLSGENSAGRKRNGEYLMKYLSNPKEAKEGFWYGSPRPAEGWTAIADFPDPERRAGTLWERLR